MIIHVMLRAQCKLSPVTILVFSRWCIVKLWTVWIWKLRWSLVLRARRWGVLTKFWRLNLKHPLWYKKTYLLINHSILKTLSVQFRRFVFFFIIFTTDIHIPFKLLIVLLYLRLHACMVEILVAELGTPMISRLLECGK